MPKMEELCEVDIDTITLRVVDVEDTIHEMRITEAALEQVFNVCGRKLEALKERGQNPD